MPYRREAATVTSLTNLGQGLYTRSITCPPVSNELHGNLPCEYMVVYVDWMEAETHDRIYVRLGENGSWMGYTETDAYPNG